MPPHKVFVKAGKRAKRSMNDEYASERLKQERYAKCSEQKKLQMESYAIDISDSDEYDENGNIIEKEDSDEYQEPPSFKTRLLELTTEDNATSGIVILCNEILEEADQMSGRWHKSRAEIEEYVNKLQTLVVENKGLTNQVIKLKKSTPEIAKPDIAKLLFPSSTVQGTFKNESSARSGIPAPRHQYDGYRGRGRGGGGRGRGGGGRGRGRGGG
jgi:hypothetical protein